MLTLGEELPGIWHSSSTTAAERKSILRLIICEVVLDQKRLQGQVWFKILWQTGATSEYSLQRCVHTYGDYIDIDKLRRCSDQSTGTIRLRIRLDARRHRILLANHSADRLRRRAAGRVYCGSRRPR